MVVTVIYMSRLVLVLVFRLQPSVVDEFHFPEIGSEKIVGDSWGFSGNGVNEFPVESLIELEPRSSK